MDPQDFSEREPCRCSQIRLVRARKLRARLLEQIAVSTLYIEHRFNGCVHMWLYLALEPEWAGETELPVQLPKGTPVRSLWPGHQGPFPLAWF